MAIIGLDVGTTGCKCIIFSDKGMNEAYAYEEYTRSLSCTTISAERIWQSVCSVLSRANEIYLEKYKESTLYKGPSSQKHCGNNNFDNKDYMETVSIDNDRVSDNCKNGNNNRNSENTDNNDSDISGNEFSTCQNANDSLNFADSSIKAISISSFGESFVPVDIYGDALSDIMLYTDPRGKDECEEFLSVISEDEIMQSCGVKPHPMYSLPKIAWIRKNQPEVFEKTWKFLLIEDYVIYKLSGVTAIDYSLASRTMAFDVTRKCWDNKLLALAGISEIKMSLPSPSGTAVGVIKPEIAISLGLPLDVKVVTGGHDQVCAAVGAGVVALGTAIDGIGTVECITPAFSSPILDSDFLNNNYACVPYAIPGMYVTYAFNFTGGALLKWFRDNFASKEEIESKESGKSVYWILDEKAAKNPTSVMVIPHFAGSGTPDMNPLDTGSIVGLTFQHGVPEIYRALLEGVTFEMKYNMELLSSVGVDITELRAVGGGAKSKLWLEIKAAITGCRILQLEVEEAGITGAAMLASVAIGIFPTLKEASEVFVKVKAIIEPDLDLKKKYEEIYTRYKKYRNASF